MLRAVPITVRTAESRLVVLRSTSLIFAISMTCFFVTFPTLLRFGSAEPLAILAARFSSTEAGGVFRMNVNVRSVYTVTSTGKIIPSGSLAVLALNCLQKSMMFKPCGPSAVPTGGAGVALPAGNCNLIVVCTFLAMSLPQSRFTCLLPRRCSTELFDAGEIQFHRRRTAKNRDRNFQPAVIVVDLFHGAVEIRERAVHDAYLLVALEDHFRLRAIRRDVDAVDDGVDFRFGQRRRRGGRPNEASDTRRRAHDVPGVFVQVHLHQHVARISHPRRHHFFAAAHL